MNQPFNEEQKQYLQGFMAGVIQRGGLPFVGQTAGGKITSDPASAARDLAAPATESVFGTPVEDLCKQERIKLERNPHDMWDTVTANARAGKFPKGDDIFRYKALGLFYVAPVQQAYMLRCRIPGCMPSSVQFRKLAALAEDYGAGYADITTRGNIQIREIGAADAVNVLMGLADMGLTSRGAGADNIRNITATPTSGFDPNEIYDVRPLAKVMHHHILNSPDLYGLPRKFNISFDSGGSISVASDTNDLCFMAVRLESGHDIDPGVYFRIGLGGITGHEDFASDTGFMVRPEDCAAAAAAMLRVYIENGNRTNRKKARLKYLLDAWGPEKFMEETQKKLDFPLISLPLETCRPRTPVVRHSHVGVHPQAKKGFNYIGVVIPVGRMQAAQMRRLADLADRFGSGDLRLTIFQNVLIPDIADDDVESVKKEILAMGFHFETPGVRSGLVACTGNAGCPFAMTDTKSHAVALGDYLEKSLRLDQPINLHFTGCPNSCAQHYCGDIGFLGVKVKQDGKSVEGYDIVVGGGMDAEQGIGRELFKAVPFDKVPPLLERVLNTYLERREGAESFVSFTRRQDEEVLRELFNEESYA